MNEPKVIGRNEPCPCKSGKKYKRCCGVGAAPKITPPKQQVQEEGVAAPAFDPTAFANNMDPQAMMKFSQALQRLPKGQLQRLQAIMQKAMNGKNITAEAAEFERTLPVEFQNLIHSFAPPSAGLPALESPSLTQPEVDSSSMTEEQARALVAQAAAEGKISPEQARDLLK